LTQKEIKMKDRYLISEPTSTEATPLDTDFVIRYPKKNIKEGLDRNKTQKMFAPYSLDVNMNLTWRTLPWEDEHPMAGEMSIGLNKKMRELLGYEIYPKPIAGLNELFGLICKVPRKLDDVELTSEQGCLRFQEVGHYNYLTFDKGVEEGVNCFADYLKQQIFYSIFTSETDARCWEITAYDRTDHYLLAHIASEVVRLCDPLRLSKREVAAVKLSPYAFSAKSVIVDRAETWRLSQEDRPEFERQKAANKAKQDEYDAMALAEAAAIRAKGGEPVWVCYRERAVTNYKYLVSKGKSITHCPFRGMPEEAMQASLDQLEKKVAEWGCSPLEKLEKVSKYYYEQRYTDSSLQYRWWVTGYLAGFDYMASLKAYV
jgi:hypothetical protein